MHTVINFNQGIVTKILKYNLVKGFEKANKSSFVIKIMSYAKISMKYKKILDMHTRIRFTMPCKSMYANLPVGCVALYFIYICTLKSNINVHCVQVKCITRLFAKNLNDFNIHLFGQTV